MPHGPIGHVRRLWSEDLRRLLVSDMAVNGTLVNVAASGAALALLAAGTDAGLAVAIHLAPIPYNVLLMIAVWRAADRAGGFLAAVARPLAVLWVLVTVVV